MTCFGASRRWKRRRRHENLRRKPGQPRAHLSRIASTPIFPSLPTSPQSARTSATRPPRAWLSRDSLTNRTAPGRRAGSTSTTSNWPSPRQWTRTLTSSALSHSHLTALTSKKPTSTPANSRLVFNYASASSFRPLDDSMDCTSTCGTSTINLWSTRPSWVRKASRTQERGCPGRRPSISSCSSISRFSKASPMNRGPSTPLATN
jgi:hypothetical protein